MKNTQRHSLALVFVCVALEIDIHYDSSRFLSAVPVFFYEFSCMSFCSAVIGHRRRRRDRRFQRNALNCFGIVSHMNELCAVDVMYALEDQTQLNRSGPDLRISLIKSATVTTHCAHLRIFLCHSVCVCVCERACRTDCFVACFSLGAS